MHSAAATLLRVLLILLALLFGTAAGLVTLAGLARWVNQLGVLLAIAALAFGLVSGGLILLVTHQSNLAAILPLAVLLALAGFVIWQFPRIDSPYQEPDPLPGMQFWHLPTGSRIAYTYIPAAGLPKPTPIIFLHGGPGWVVLDSDVRFYSQLAEDGFDVYLFDQAGSGRSSRLKAQEITTSRYVADLEAIRQQIGTQQVILIGQSWGNTLAADYMAAYPNHVAAVIFSSPGAIWDVGRFKPDYSRTANVSSSVLGLPPLRVLAAMLMIPRNPRLAEQIASPQALSSFFDNLPSSSLLGQNYCAGDEAKVPKIKVLGTNQYVNRLVFASQETYPDPRPALRQNSTPALILRGACEFLPEAVALEYKETLPNATYVTIPNAGHALYGAQPDVVLSTMRAFLTREIAPVPEYSQ